MLNQHICEALDLIQAIEWAIVEVVIAVEWAEEEMESNKNARKDNKSTADFLAYYQGDLRYLKNELGKANVRLDICIRTFKKGGWAF